jgi:hypothetical protein
MTGIAICFSLLSITTNVTMAFAEVINKKYDGQDINLDGPDLDIEINDVEEKPEVEIETPIDSKVELKTEFINEKEIKFTWQHLDNAENYIIYKNGAKLVEFSVFEEKESYSYIDQNSEITKANYVFRAIDDEGNLLEETLITQDEEAQHPLVPPSGLKTLPRDNAYIVGIQWNQVKDAIYYQVYRDDVLVSEVPNYDTTIVYEDNQAEPNVQYTYSVTAVDVNTIESEKVTVLSNLYDTEAPPIPTELFIKEAATNQVHLAWTPVEEVSDLFRYKVYMRTGQEEFESVELTDENYFIADGLGPEQTYEFKVTTLDLSRNESQFSNVISITTGSDLSKITYEKLPLTFKVEEVVIKKIEKKEKKIQSIEMTKEAEELPKVKSETGRLEENMDIAVE